jgi:hypothetical protein
MWLRCPLLLHLCLLELLPVQLFDAVSFQIVKTFPAYLLRHHVVFCLFHLLVMVHSFSELLFFFLSWFIVVLTDFYFNFRQEETRNFQGLTQFLLTGSIYLNLY